MGAAERFGACDNIRLFDFSVFITPPKDSVMASMRGWADDSLTLGRVWAVGGYVGGPFPWEHFEKQWPLVLAKHSVPYFHMKEMGKPNGPFSKWLPHQDHREEVKTFLRDLVQVISDAYLRGFFSIVRIDDLERFNAETGLNLEPYPLGVYGCQVALAREYPNVSIGVVFDHLEKAESKLATARKYAEADGYYGADLDNISSTPLARNTTFRMVPALQAADFFIWELRKHHLGLDEWFSLEEKPTDWDARERHLDQWSSQKFGDIRPSARKSLDAIVDSAAPVTGIIWDYDRLCEAHRLRGGVWTAS